jgi:hypothetical protein
MVPFEQVLARVTIKDVLENAGLPVTRNRIACPIHGGDNPTSFAFTDSVFYCHRCGAKGGLLALTAYLHKCSEREAVRRLYELAGFPPPGSETISNGARPKPKWIAPRPRHSVEYYDAENTLAWLELLDEALLCCLRIARRAVREGRMPLDKFYLREQVCIYELEELDPVIIAMKYRVNQLKKKETKNDDYTSSNN